MSIGCKINLNYKRADFSLVEQLKYFAVANIDDNMSRMAAISSQIRPLNKTRLFGTAFTVRVAPGDNLFFHEAMELAKPGDVFMIDAGGYTDRAIFGEIMISYCRMRRFNGVVVDGAVRDSGALSKLTDFAVYAKGITPNGPYKNGPGEIGGIISIGGKTVKPGDIIIGDEDGVVIIDPEDAPRIIEATRKTQEKETVALEKMRTTGEYKHDWMYDILKNIGCEGLEFLDKM